MNDTNKLLDIQFNHVIFKFYKELEAEFFDDFFSSSLGFIRFSLFFSMILIALFGILDIWIMSTSKPYTWFIRYIILCPATFIGFILTFFHFFKNIMQFLLCFYCFLAGLGFIIMIVIAKETELGFMFYYVGLIQVIIAGHILFRLRFIHATIVSWIIILIYEIVCIYFRGMLSSPEKIFIFINNNFFLISTNLIGMIASFFIEFFMRKDFLLRKKIHYEKEQKTIFFINLAHETKTSLTLAQSSMNEYLKKNKLTGELKTLKYNIQKLCRDIINLLDSEKINQGTLIYNHTSVIDVSKALSNKINQFQAFVHIKNIHLTYSGGDLLFLKIDIYAFDRIINNIIDNAIRYTNEYGWVDVVLKPCGSNIHIIVTDTGCGISGEQKNNIYQPYYQISREKRNIQGLGMGLYIVKNIIDSLNGSIRIESELNKGTIFTIILPKHKVKEDDIIEDFLPKELDSSIFKSKLMEEVYDKNKYSVFIIEDNIELISYMQRSMYSDFNVFYATDGQRALTKLKIIPAPDIIISDIMMDIMNGHEFYNNIAKHDRLKMIPFLFLTARTEHDEKIESLKKGVTDYIYKPFIMEELIAKVKNILKRYKDLKKTESDKLKRQLLSAIQYDESEEKKEIEEKQLNIFCQNYNISTREREIVYYLLKGLENKEIADVLHMSFHTARNHTSSIYKKCTVNNKMELARLIYTRYLL